jgi:hypothetical protein
MRYENKVVIYVRGGVAEVVSCPLHVDVQIVDWDNMIGSDWFSETGEILMEIPYPCIRDCSHGGQCHSDVAYWQNELGFEIPAELETMAREYIKSTGGFSDDWDTCTMTELAQYVLWLGCNEINEQGEWFGLME